jgi:HisJ family histidinol phosphate phosphatase
MIEKAASRFAFDAEDVIKDPPLVEQHCHTNFTDGRDSVDEMVISAVKKKLNRIIITEHIQRRSTWVDKFLHEVEKAVNEYSNQIEIGYGFESKLINYDGDIDILESIADESPLILGAVHGYPQEEAENQFYEFKELSAEDAIELEFKSLKALLKNNSVDIIAHPLGVFERNYGVVSKTHYEQAVKLIGENNKIFEINSRYLSDLYPVLELCNKHQVMVSLGSDAHAKEELGSVLNILREKKNEG